MQVSSLESMVYEKPIRKGRIINTGQGNIPKAICWEYVFLYIAQMLIQLQYQLFLNVHSVTGTFVWLMSVFVPTNM